CTGDVYGAAGAVRGVWGAVRADAGVLDRSAADRRVATVSTGHDDRAAGHPWAGDWVVCAGAAGGAAVYDVSAGAAAGDPLDRGQDLRAELGGEPGEGGGRGVAGRPFAQPGAGLVDADHATGAKPVPVEREDVWAEAAGDIALGADRAVLHQGPD